MKRVAITGAAGFVGANLARASLRDGHAVHLLVHPEAATWRIDAIRRDVDVHAVDLADAGTVAHAIDAIRPEWVFHLAAHGAYSWQTDLARMVQTNVVGTMHLLQACIRIGFDAFVNTGSSSEYGFKAHPPAEGEPLEPNSDYAVTKASATLLCRHVARSRGLRVCTLRLYSVYGPYEEPRRLLPTLIVRGLRGELPPLVDARVARDYVYVDDVVEAYRLAAARPQQEPGAVYNVGTGVQTSLREVIDVARRTMAIAAEPAWGSMPERTWDTNVWVCDNRAIREALGWRPRQGLEQGLRLMIEWFRENPSIRARYEELLGTT